MQTKKDEKVLADLPDYEIYLAKLILEVALTLRSLKFILVDPRFSTDSNSNRMMQTRLSEQFPTPPIILDF